MNNGWIKIHRKIRDNCIYKDSHLLHLFIHCLLKANHKTNTFLFNKQEITIERGQFVTGRLELANELNMNSSLVYRKLNILKNIGIVNIKTNNKFSIVTVLKYNTYQDMITTSEQQNEQQVNNKRTTSEQQVNTNKNGKNDKNEKNRDRAQKNKLLCLFENSEFYDFAKFKESFLKNDKYSGYDVSYYYEAVKNWSASNNKMKKDWIATAHNFALTDSNPKFSKNGNVEMIKLPD